MANNNYDFFDYWAMLVYPWVILLCFINFIFDSGYIKANKLSPETDCFSDCQRLALDSLWSWQFGKETVRLIRENSEPVAG